MNDKKRLKDFIPRDLSDRDLEIYEQAMIIKTDPTQHLVLYGLASQVQSALLEDVLVNESRIMMHTDDYYTNELNEEI